MPKHRQNKQIFGDTASPTAWDSSSSDPEAGKVYIAGGSLDGLDIPGPLDGSTQLVTWVTFNITTSAWVTVQEATASEYLEVRIFGVSNKSQTVVDFRARMGTSTPFFDQPIPAGGGGYNQNCIGAYKYGTLGEDLQVSLSTGVDSYKGHFVIQVI